MNELKSCVDIVDQSVNIFLGVVVGKKFRATVTERMTTTRLCKAIKAMMIQAVIEQIQMRKAQYIKTKGRVIDTHCKE